MGWPWLEAPPRLCSVGQVEPSILVQEEQPGSCGQAGSLLFHISQGFLSPSLCLLPTPFLSSFKLRSLSNSVVSPWPIWLSWLVEHCPVHQQVTGSIPGQGTCPGCGLAAD